MGRKAQVRYFDSKGGYYTTYQGVRHKLAIGPDDAPAGPTYGAALEAYKAVIAGETAPDRRDCRLLACVERYTDHIEKHCSPASLSQIKDVLPRGVKKWGALNVSEFRIYHLEEWLKEEKDWGPSTKCAAWSRVKDALSWNLKQGYITKSPLQGVSLPSYARGKVRGEEFVIEPELRDLLLAGANPVFADYLRALARTGARPSEIANAEHYHYRKEIGALVYEPDPKKGYRHKNSRKKKTRTIYLPADIVETAEAKIKKQGPGYIWMSPRGKRLSIRNAMRCFDRLKKTQPVRTYLRSKDRDLNTVILYGFRHTFITNALLDKRANVKLLADLMGNSVAMIESRYAHCMSDKQGMRTIFLDYAGKV